MLAPATLHLYYSRSACSTYCNSTGTRILCFVYLDVTVATSPQPPARCTHHQMHHGIGSEFGVWDPKSVVQVLNRHSNVFCITYLGLWNGLLSIWLRNTNCVTCKQSRDVRMKTSRTSLGWKRPECTRNRKTSKGFMKDVSKRNKTLIYLPYWIKPTRTGTQMNKFASNRPTCVKLPKTRLKK